jgi:hypothetical protein
MALLPRIVRAKARFPYDVRAQARDFPVSF